MLFFVRRRLWPASVYAAAAAYLATALWVFRVVLPSPATTIPIQSYLSPEASKLAISDEMMVTFTIARNARNLLHANTQLFEAGQCYPMPLALSFGEHMLGNGLLGAPPYLLTRDPILTFNWVVIVTFWISALAAFAVVFHWTGDAGAAFVAGMLYGFHPVRTQDPMHPFINANQWTALAFLFADSLFRRRRWVDAVGLGACLSLQLLESFYTVLGLVILGGIYGIHLAWVYRRHLATLLPKLAVALVPPSLVAVWVYSPYLQSRAAWGALQGRRTLLLFPWNLGPGGPSYVGSVILVLAAVALIDRARGRWRPPTSSADDVSAPPPGDPRLALALAGFLAFWACVFYVPLPFGFGRLPSLWNMVSGFIPGMDAVRAGASLRLGVYLVGALLAGYGVAALRRGRSPAVRIAIVLLVMAAWSIESFVQDVATRAYGHHTDFLPLSARPAEETVRLYRGLDAGPVLDLPASADSIDGYLFQSSDYLLLHAYHHQPVATCNNSFITPQNVQLIKLANSFQERAWKLDALYAVGFRSLMVHWDRLKPEQHPRLMDILRRLQRGRPGHAYLVEVGGDGERTRYDIRGEVPMFTDLAQLDFETEAQTVTRPRAQLKALIRNHSGAVFASPRPLRPKEVILRWYNSAGELVSESRQSFASPLAVTGNGREPYFFADVIPANGDEFTVAVSFAEDPEHVVVRIPVRVAAAS